MKTCKECKKEFDIKKFGLQGRGLTFCSFPCHDKYMDKKVQSEDVREVQDGS